MTRASSPCPTEPLRRGEGDALLPMYRPLPPGEPSRIMAAWAPVLARTAGAGPRAVARRDWWTAWLTGDLGLFPAGTLDLPVPRITDAEYDARTTGTFSADPDPAKRRGSQSLILQLPNDLHAPHVKKSKRGGHASSLGYDRFMAAVGQQDHWTVTDVAERKKIRWEPVLTPTWRWIETPDYCPRTGTSWNDLATLLPGCMPSLEEYVAAWHATKHEHNRMLDVSIYCWLRTRFGPSGSGALGALGCGGRVGVYWWVAAGLGIAVSDYGSRASDPVKP